MAYSASPVLSAGHTRQIFFPLPSLPIRLVKFECTAKPQVVDMNWPTLSAGSVDCLQSLRSESSSTFLTYGEISYGNSQAVAEAISEGVPSCVAASWILEGRGHPGCETQGWLPVSRCRVTAGVLFT